MPEIKDIVKLAIDACKGNVEKYSVAQSQEALRQALIEANGGSSVVNYRNMRDGKCSAVFAIIEQVIPAMVMEGLQEDDYFNSMVEYHNVALGDMRTFVIENSTLFFVAKVADGTQGIRRQRISDVEEIEVKTSMHAIRIYEELNRVLAGRVDFNKMIAKVTESFRRAILDEIYALWGAVTDTELGDAYYTAGAFDQDELLEMIAHVEAASGKTATIIGTRKALRNLADDMMTDLNSPSVRDDMYHMGYVGSYFGTPVVAQPQRHKVGSTEFAIADNVLTVVATGEKPIKFVYEGDALVIPGNPMDNADLTQELEYAA